MEINLPATQILIEETVASIRSQVIIVANKSDLGVDYLTMEFLKSLIRPVINISAKSGDGIVALIDELVSQVASGYDKYSEEIIITSKRQNEVLTKTVEHISQAVNILTVLGQAGQEGGAKNLTEFSSAVIPAR